MNPTREKEAVSAYLKLLQTKGAGEDVLQKRALFLDKLSPHLTGKVLDGSEYREVIDIVMETMPSEDWHDCLNAAREFYPFWISDFKAIASLSLKTGFDIQPLQWRPIQTSLKTLWDSLETEKFDTSENWPLKAYTQALRFEGAEQSLVDTRVKLAKVILIRLRDAPAKNRKSYRTAVDLTLPLFNIKQNRRLFLVVVREFYHFWCGNPDAASMVLQDGSGNMLQ
ncbi:MAG TPA: hypothetical protein VK946_07020 [Methylotenera sp.]|nr:hypothetical protein [Methylotenera sp.]HSI38806.1 hypothetical protein [Methylotenera sp.]